MAIDADFPAKLHCLFQPSRYKVLYGGRGAGRSWGIARALLLQGTQQPLRILCAREFQNSISDSVHKLLSDQIVALGLTDFYVVLQSRIEGKNGTYFAFEGIKNNVGRIKSYEAIDRCWVEEADKTSRNSWGVLIPTIRKPDSEIWLSFNPSLDTDYTYKRFVLEADESMIVQRMTWADNPWFPDVLRDEMLRDKERDYDYYLNVWEGHCVQQLEGAIYAKELRKAQEQGRIGEVPWEKTAPVDTWWDLGRADRTAIWFGQRAAMQNRLIDYYENSGEDITHYLKYLQKKGYVYGTIWLPHDAKAKRLGSGRSIEEIVRGYGFNVKIVPRLSVIDGINAGRMAFQSTYFDEKRCADGLNRLRHYRYRVIDGHLSNEPLHDDASDGSDAFRYYAVASKTPTSTSGMIKERLAAAAAALRGEYENSEEFSGRQGSPARSLGWMS